MGKEIGEKRNFFGRVDGAFFADFDVVDFAKSFKIFKRKEAQVGRIVPLIGQLFGDRNAAAKKYLKSRKDMAKVWYADDNFLADT